MTASRMPGRSEGRLVEGSLAERRHESLSSTARVLVASDNLEDAAQVARLLKSEFGNVLESTDPEREVEDFEAFEPQVLVLAFETMEKVQSYALGLYRFSRKASAHAHRTVVLCNKDEVRAAFALCRKGSFDDYVLYWPHAQDGLRLTMSVLSALRQLSATVVRGPSHVELVSHVRQVSAMQSVIDEQLKAAEQLPPAASGSLGRPETASAIEPATSKLASDLRDKLAPHMRALASLGEKVSKTRPVVMLVDDDEVMQLVVAGALDRTPYDLISAHDATAAVSLLRRHPTDLILMDVNLPDISGITLTQRLKLLADFAGIPVVMVTSDGRRETIEDSLKAGAADFIVKPFAREAVIKKLDRFLSALRARP